MRKTRTVFWVVCCLLGLVAVLWSGTMDNFPQIDGETRNRLETVIDSATNNAVAACVSTNDAAYLKAVTNIVGGANLTESRSGRVSTLDLDSSISLDSVTATNGTFITLVAESITNNVFSTTNVTLNGFLIIKSTGVFTNDAESVLSNLTVRGTQTTAGAATFNGPVTVAAAETNTVSTVLSNLNVNGKTVSSGLSIWQTAATGTNYFAGNAGFGLSTTPNTPITVQGSSTGDKILLRAGNIGGGANQNTVSLTLSPGANVIDDAVKLVAGKSAADAWTTEGNRSAYFSIETVNANTLSEKMRVTAIGDVGIGTNSPAAKVHIGGTSATGYALHQDSGTMTNWFVGLAKFDALTTITNIPNGAVATAPVNLSQLQGATNGNVASATYASVANQASNSYLADWASWANNASNALAATYATTANTSSNCVGNSVTATYATTANTASNLSFVVAYATEASHSTNSDAATYATVANTASNLIGNIATADYATTANTASNLVGNVETATYATTANNSSNLVAGASLLGIVNGAGFKGTNFGNAAAAQDLTTLTQLQGATNQIAGGSVVGAVATATYATTANTSSNCVGNSVTATYATTANTASNISFVVAYATEASHATNADASTTATYATTANTASNLVGTAALATYATTANNASNLVGSASFASVAETLAGAEATKAIAPLTLAAELVKNLKPVTYASTNILDVFTKSGNAAPNATNIITVAIPDGTGYSWRSRSGAYASGTSQILLVDGTNYWSKGSVNGEIKNAYVYAIWDATGTGLVWAVGGYSGWNRVPSTTATADDDFFLLETSSTYTKSTNDYCVPVARVRYEYDTGDTPDHTIQIGDEDVPQIVWNPKSDYSRLFTMATTITSNGVNIAQASILSGICKQPGRYTINGGDVAYCAAGKSSQEIYIKTGNAVYGSAVQRGYSILGIPSTGTDTCPPLIVDVYLRIGDTIHLGATLTGVSGDRIIRGDDFVAGSTYLKFNRID